MTYSLSLLNKTIVYKLTQGRSWKINGEIEWPEQDSSQKHVPLYIDVLITDKLEAEQLESHKL